MPFQPLQDSDPDKPCLADLGLLVIRLLAVATFTYYQLNRQLHLAVDHLWEGADWDLVSQLAERGLPSPDLIAAAAVGIQIVTLLGVVLRLSFHPDDWILALFGDRPLAEPQSPGLGPLPRHFPWSRLRRSRSPLPRSPPRRPPCPEAGRLKTGQGPRSRLFRKIQMKFPLKAGAVAALIPDAFV